MSSPGSSESLADGAYHLFVAKHYSLAALGLAFYEWAITLDREVESVWKRKFTFATVLWFLNRYLPSLSHIPTEVAMLLPISHETCLRFVHFPGVIQIISNLAIGLTLIIRTYALYHRNFIVLGILLPPYFASFALECWAVAGGVPVPVHPGFSGCILTGKAGSGDRFAGLWFGQLVFPTIIFALTTGRILWLRRHGTLGEGFATLMLRDGTMYFFVILFVNLLNVLTYVSAPTDLQAVNASFSSIMQGMMICRLMLNLRGGVSGRSSYGGGGGKVRSRPPDNFVGNLGADIDFDEYDHERSTISSASVSASGVVSFIMTRRESVHDDQGHSIVYSPTRPGPGPNDSFLDTTDTIPGRRQGMSKESYVVSSV